jgi:PIN domain nuclease of toxin-antitoxin system
MTTERTEKKPVGLTLRQKKFCKLYVSDTEFFGNGVKSYAKVYSIDLTKKSSYKVAKAAASRMLTNVNLLDYMNKLLDDMGLNKVHVDKQLAFLITQNAELGIKMAAIREFNKLRQRIEDKTKVQGGITVVIKDRAGRKEKSTDDKKKGLV